jgi:bacterioferritin
MEIYSRYKSKLVPTCIKETLERKNLYSIKGETPAESPVGNVPQNNPNGKIKEPANTPLIERPVDKSPSNNRGDISPLPPSKDNQNLIPNSSDETQNLIFRVADPYPQLTNVIPNRADVRQLKSLTSGRKSELSAILTYLYQSYILQAEYPAISKALKRVAKVEMDHYDVLSEAIVAFGGDPNLTDGQGNIWTGRNISTVKDVRKILENNIKAEKAAVAEYTKAARETSNDSLAALYLRIARDEALHIAVFNYLLSTLSR